MEDAVTFLERAKAVYSDVTLLLNKTQLLALDKDPNEPFGDTVSDDHPVAYLHVHQGIGGPG